jgi:hypothetical protein
MGALGWSEGDGVSSVVCAHALKAKLLTTVNVKMAIPDRNLFFINIFSDTYFFKPVCKRNISLSKKQLPCQDGGIFMILNYAFSMIWRDLKEAI